MCVGVESLSSVCGLLLVWNPNCVCVYNQNCHFFFLFLNQQFYYYSSAWQQVALAMYTLQRDAVVIFLLRALSPTAYELS